MSAIAALRAQPDVLYAEPDIIMHATLTPNDPCFPVNNLPVCQSTSIQSNDLYGLRMIGAPAAWNTTTGSSNVVVGVVDPITGSLDGDDCRAAARLGLGPLLLELANLLRPVGQDRLALVADGFQGSLAHRRQQQPAHRQHRPRRRIRLQVA